VNFLKDLSQNQLLVWLVYVLTKTAVVATVAAVLYWGLERTSPAFKEFMRGVFSDGGTPSFSRVATGCLVLACLGMDGYLVVRNHTFPDVGGQVLLIGTLYGVNVAGSTASKFSGK